jgi:hypothetical protein
MHVEAYLVAVRFSNRPDITGIDANEVLLTSDIMLVGGSFSVSQSAANNPRAFAAEFTNGLLDLSVFDTVFGLPVWETDYTSPLDMSASEVGSQPITGELTGDLVSLGSSDPDFLSAFAPFAKLDANFSGFFSDGSSVGFNMCNLVKAGAVIYPNPPALQTCAGGYALDDFTTNAVITIIPIPEPGTALLLGLGLAGVVALRRK